jgi:hypothetical protein
MKKFFKAISNFQFSKLIILFESILVALTSWKVIQFTEVAINRGFTGSLPYLTTFLGVLFSAYGVSVSFYYNKSKNENLAYISNEHEIRKIQLNTDVDCDSFDESEDV